jgi:hypothetical protein
MEKKPLSSPEISSSTSRGKSSGKFPENFLASATRQSSTLFLDTIQSTSSMDEHFGMNDFDHFGKARPRHHDLDEPTENDLESNWTRNHRDRATWWPLPRESLVESDITYSKDKTHIREKLE